MKPNSSPPPAQTHVISTEGGAFAAAVERPLYFLPIAPAAGNSARQTFNIAKDIPPHLR